MFNKQTVTCKRCGEVVADVKEDLREIKVGPRKQNSLALRMVVKKLDDKECVMTPEVYSTEGECQVIGTLLPVMVASEAVDVVLEEDTDITAHEGETVEIGDAPDEEDKAWPKKDDG